MAMLGDPNNPKKIFANRKYNSGITAISFSTNSYIGRRIMLLLVYTCYVTGLVPCWLG